MRKFLLVCCLALLSACASKSTLSATDPDVVLKVNSEAPTRVGEGLNRRLSDTTFGHYRFKASAEDGTTMFGLMPLQFKGGNLVMDILFFAPATFLNLRGLFPFYEFDPERNVVRYKTSKNAPWREYTPTANEVAHAKKYFGE